MASKTTKTKTQKYVEVPLQYGKNAKKVTLRNTMSENDRSKLTRYQKYRLQQQRTRAAKEIQLGADLQKTKRVEAIAKTAMASESIAGGTSTANEFARNITTSNSLINPIIKQDDDDTTSESNESSQNTNWIPNVGGR